MQLDLYGKTKAAPVTTLACINAPRRFWVEFQIIVTMRRRVDLSLPCRAEVRLAYGEPKSRINETPGCPRMVDPDRRSGEKSRRETRGTRRRVARITQGRQPSKPLMASSGPGGAQLKTSPTLGANRWGRV